jgi:uncharacterized protein (TIGR02118 family)
MVKILFTLQRAQRFNLEEFPGYYSNQHSKLALECQPRLVGYATNVPDDQALLPLNVGRDARGLPFDGLTALQFIDLKDFTEPGRRYASKEAEMRFTEDSNQLTTSAHGYMVEEALQWDRLEPQPEGTPSLGFKVIALSRRAPGISKKNFISHYRNVHTELARKHHPGISRYTQNFVVNKLTPDAPDIDAFAELHFASREDFTDRFYATPESRQIIWNDVKAFADLKSVRFITAIETIWKRPPASHL